MVAAVAFRHHELLGSGRKIRPASPRVHLSYLFRKPRPLLGRCAEQARENVVNFRLSRRSKSYITKLLFLRGRNTTGALQLKVPRLGLSLKSMRIVTDVILCISYLSKISLRPTNLCYCTALIISKIGRYIATTMPPTTTPRNTIITGSNIDSKLDTAESTSSS